jgi:5'/3'-nucleotidase SurE
VTSLKYGLDTFGPQIWSGQQPELVVAGPNVGANLWLQVRFSGTVGIAVHAAHIARIPGIAFSGATTGTLAWDTVPVPTRSLLYAELATNLTQAILDSGAPYLPSNVWLNVNFPKVEGLCTSARQFTWILTRINPGFLSKDDVEHCGTKRLPTEEEVSRSGGCRISVSVGDATDKSTASADKQVVVLKKLKDMLTCLR